MIKTKSLRVKLGAGISNQLKWIAWYQVWTGSSDHLKHVCYFTQQSCLKPVCQIPLLHPVQVGRALCKISKPSPPRGTSRACSCLQSRTSPSRAHCPGLPSPLFQSSNADTCSCQDCPLQQWNISRYPCIRHQWYDMLTGEACKHQEKSKVPYWVDLKVLTRRAKYF